MLLTSTAQLACIPHWRIFRISVVELLWARKKPLMLSAMTFGGGLLHWHHLAHPDCTTIIVYIGRLSNFHLFLWAHMQPCLPFFSQFSWIALLMCCSHFPNSGISQSAAAHILIDALTPPRALLKHFFRELPVCIRWCSLHHFSCLFLTCYEILLKGLFTLCV